MCLGVPGLLIERTEPAGELAQGVVEFAGIRRRICLACVPEAQPGDYVVVHAGIAISRINATEAGRVFAYLQEIGDNDGWTPEKGLTPTER
jgi:hydrogenase expression/formation protein HypC